MAIFRKRRFKAKKEEDLGYSFINIFTLGSIYDDTRSGVIFTECNVVIHENNYILILQSSFPQYLIGMTYISLKETQRSTVTLDLTNSVTILGAKCHLMPIILIAI